MLCPILLCCAQIWGSAAKTLFKIYNLSKTKLYEVLYIHLDTEEIRLSIMTSKFLRLDQLSKIKPSSFSVILLLFLILPYKISLFMMSMLIGVGLVERFFFLKISTLISFFIAVYFDRISYSGRSLYYPFSKFYIYLYIFFFIFLYYYY